MLNATATALCLQVLSQEPEDHRAVAVPRHDGTPEKIELPGAARHQRLNGKLRGLRSTERSLTRLAATDAPEFHLHQLSLEAKALRSALVPF